MQNALVEQLLASRGMVFVSQSGGVCMHSPPRGNRTCALEIQLYVARRLVRNFPPSPSRYTLSVRH
eukprot:SAG11_NODE_28892_length_316_cov_1.672811_1_plen_65_part_01